MLSYMWERKTGPLSAFWVFLYKITLVDQNPMRNCCLVVTGIFVSFIESENSDVKETWIRTFSSVPETAYWTTLVGHNHLWTKCQSFAHQKGLKIILRLIIPSRSLTCILMCFLAWVTKWRCHFLACVYLWPWAVLVNNIYYEDKSWEFSHH